jgi:hypothetical protein
MTPLTVTTVTTVDRDDRGNGHEPRWGRFVVKLAGIR